MPKKCTAVLLSMSMPGKRITTLIALVEYAYNMYGRFISIKYKCLAPAPKRSMERLVCLTFATQSGYGSPAMRVKNRKSKVMSCYLTRQLPVTYSTFA